MPSFIELGKQIGISRQTASSKFKELLNINLVSLNDDNIINVKNELNIDVDLLRDYLDNYINKFDAVQLRFILFDDIKGEISKTQLAKEMGLSRNSLYTDNHSVIYAIHSEGKIKYIGTTSHYRDRIAQHIKKRPFLTSANFLILVEDTDVDKFNIELNLIHLLKPEWNKMGIEI